MLAGKKTRKGRGNPEVPAFKKQMWKAGQSGNAEGRRVEKPLARALMALATELYPVEVIDARLRDRLLLQPKKKYTCAEVAARYLFLSVQTGRGGIAVAYREMADRVEGKVTDVVQWSRPEEKDDIDLSVLPTKELRTVMALLRKAKAGGDLHPDHMRFKGPHPEEVRRTRPSPGRKETRNPKTSEVFSEPWVHASKADGRSQAVENAPANLPELVVKRGLPCGVQRGGREDDDGDSDGFIGAKAVW